VSGAIYAFVREVFRKHRDKDWSYTDCGLLVLSRRTGVRGIFAFDRHFSQMPGMERRPRG
jgi:predicted nucleic acid-binding protein